MNFLAFDLGAGSGKLYLARYEDGRLSLETVCRMENGPIAIRNGLYWDIPGIWRELCNGIRKAVKITQDQITSIGFDSFCNDFGLIGENGELLTQIHCYRDPRTERCEKAMNEVMSSRELYRINGNQKGLFNTLPQLHAMLCDNEKWLLENSRCALFVSDLFSYLLTDRTVTEYTTASVTQMFDYAAGAWSDTVFERFGIRESLFAPLIMPGDTVGRTSDTINGQLKTVGFPVVAVCQHDTASAFLGAACGRENAIISSGTWSVVGTEAETPIINEYGFLHNLANEGSVAGHHRILKNTMGTWILQEMVRELREQDREYSFAELDEMASVYYGSSCVVDVDDIRFYAPGRMIEKIRDYCQENGMRQPEGLGEMVYAIQAGLALRYRMAIEELENLTGKPLKGINIVGGGSQSTLACRLTADICGRTVMAGPADATALGNVLVQMMAAGVISSVEEGRAQIRRSFNVSEYHPAEDRTKWEILYKDFHDGKQHGTESVQEPKG
ncbi:MAG: rhamnulokinase [Eubacterium sp.]|nr:rhamnulokinase [Eubacterium sp.]